MKAQFDYSSPHKIVNHKDIRVEFTGRNLTKFGGIQLLRRFLGHLKVKEELANAAAVNKRDGRFSAGGMLTCLLYAVILDFKRQSDTLMLRLDKVFHKIDGKLIKSGRKFILKLQEDWAYKEEYNEAEKRLKALAWVT